MPGMTVAILKQESIDATISVEVHAEMVIKVNNLEMVIAQYAER